MPIFEHLFGRREGNWICDFSNWNLQSGADLPPNILLKVFDVEKTLKDFLLIKTPSVNLGLQVFQGVATITTPLVALIVLKLPRGEEKLHHLLQRNQQEKLTANGSTAGYQHLANNESRSHQEPPKTGWFCRVFHWFLITEILEGKTKSSL